MITTEDYHNFIVKTRKKPPEIFQNDNIKDVMEIGRSEMKMLDGKVQEIEETELFEI